MTGSVETAEAGIWCCELELAGEQGIRSVLPLRGQHEVRTLVRLHGEPLGYVSSPSGAAGPDVRAITAEARRRFADPIRAHLAAEAITSGAEPVAAVDAPEVPIPQQTSTCPNRTRSTAFVSVIVCTRNRSGILRGCLQRLSELRHEPIEIVVVDNAPSDDSTSRLVGEFAERDGRFRYALEPRPGLSNARNRGLAEARGEYIAYTDDDVAVDPEWIDGLLLGFERHPAAGCVTGLVCTADISGAAEHYFDARAASWSSRCETEVFDLGPHRRQDALYPYSPGIFGTGANFAFDRTLLGDLGGFDVALGAGTPTKGGEDLDIFVRVLLHGRAIVYQPSAVVWHHHRADLRSLHKQMFGYGTGLTAFLTKCLLQRQTRTDVLRRIPRGFARIARIRAQTTERLSPSAAAPRGALAREYAGFLAGPFLYGRARRSGRAETGPVA